MQIFQTFKFPLAALLALGFLASATNARADVGRPKQFEDLTAPAPQAPGHAPSLIYGPSVLSAEEARHKEHLPVQLEAAISKVKAARYSPKGLAHKTVTDF